MGWHVEHANQKLEVKNKLIRRLSNKLLFRHEKSRAEPEASNSLTSKKLRGNTFKLEFFRPKARSVEKTRGDTFRLEFFRLKAHSVEKTHGDTFKLEIFRQKGHSIEQTRGGSVQARVFSTKCTRRRDRRVFSSRLAPKGSPSARRPKVVKS